MGFPARGTTHFEAGLNFDIFAMMSFRDYRNPVPQLHQNAHSVMTESVYSLSDLLNPKSSPNLFIKSIIPQIFFQLCTKFIF